MYALAVGSERRALLMLGDSWCARAIVVYCSPPPKPKQGKVAVETYKTVPRMRSDYREARTPRSGVAVVS